MKTKRNIIFPKLWAFLSLIALITFLGYWNYTNYQSEKAQLSQNLENQLQLAYSEIMDSVIIEEIIIMTTINDSNFKLTTNAMKKGDLRSTLTDSLDKQLRYVDLTEQPEYKDSFTIVTYSDKLTDIAQQKMKSDSIRRFEFAPKFFQTENDDSMKIDNFSMVVKNMLTVEDSHIPAIERRFQSKIKALGYPSTFVNPDSSLHSAIPISYVGDNDNSIPVSFAISKYQSYIWKNISSPILLSFLLLSAVCIAFWSLITSWTKQQKLIETKNEFISNMTHELKTPISTVSVALEAISGFDLEVDASKTKEYVDISRQELNRLTLLVNKVLKMASYEGQNEEMKSEEINLAETTQNIVNSMKLQLQEKEAIVTYVNDTKSAEIIGDKVHITNVIYNIIDNALKYSNETPSINIGLKERKEHLLLSISDNGKGIPKEYLNKIFDRFFRIPTSDRHNVKGHGLGLSYVKDVINNHSGDIAVESTLGKGTTFTISIPKTDSHG